MVSPMVDTILVLVTIISLTFAAVMGVIVWRMLHLEQKRSAARVAALVDAVDMAESDGIPDPGSLPQWTDLVIERTARVSRQTADDSAAAAHLFRPAEVPEGNGRRLVAGFALATTFLVLAAAVVVSVSTRVSVAARAEFAPPPLELLSLEHAHTGGQLAIRGVVRNPVARGVTEGLVAVVFLLDKDGGYLGTFKQPVVETVLPPGADSPFEVSVSDRLPVSRYRLTFHVGRGPVPHLDRRVATPAERTSPERAVTPSRNATVLSASATR